MAHKPEVLEQLIKESTSFSEVLVKMGRKPVGGSISNLHLRCKRLNIDVSHLLGQAHNKGKPASHRRTADEVLVMGSPRDHRTKATVLRRALREIGIGYYCKKCGIEDWRGKALTLEIDHKDGQYWNNSRENLQYLCPNCHSQK